MITLLTQESRCTIVNLAMKDDLPPLMAVAELFKPLRVTRGSTFAKSRVGIQAGCCGLNPIEHRREVEGIYCGHYDGNPSSFLSQLTIIPNPEMEV